MVYVYTDGGYRENAKKQSVVTWAMVVYKDRNSPTPLHTHGGCVKNLNGMRNIVGELFAAVEAIKWAIAYGHDHIHIVHDYTGVAEWAEDRWKAKNAVTQRYKELIRQYRTQIRITFEHVKSHSGHVRNNAADRLATDKAKAYFANPSKVRYDTNELFDVTLTQQTSMFDWQETPPPPPPSSTATDTLDRFFDGSVYNFD